YQPYHSWGANQQRVGGGRNFTNDLQVDGAPVGIGVKTGYVPSPDMVQEVNVQQNAVDAEFGNSSGSAISLTLKSGTNQWHGTAFYQGQYPWANALENRVFRTVNLGRTHMFGGTLGHPILKNKLFNFIAYEGWEKTDPQTLLQTLPTALERRGDFSQSFNAAGGLRTIYDPWSTVVSPDGRTVTRTPFPGNVIPQDRLDPIAVAYASKLWEPNSPGTGPYHVNNYSVALPIFFPYKNFSDRVDYNVSDRLRISGRVSLFRTPVKTTNPTGSDYFLSDRGSQRDGSSYTGDVTYTLTPTTVLNVRGAYHDFVDASMFDGDFSADGGWAKIWPNSNFYKDVFAESGIPVLLPRMSLSGTDNTRRFNLGPGGGYWDQRPNGDSINIKVAHQRGAHYLKAGVDTRGNRTSSLLQLSNPGFGFDAVPTSSTYINPDLLQSGDSFATFLLGAIAPTTGGASAWDSNGTSMPVLIVPKTQTRIYGLFVNDDWKITRDLTINLGLRYEYEQPFYDPENRLTRPLDLTAPIPEFQGANAPVMPTEVSQFYKGPWTFNGAFNFADSENRGQWNSRGGAWSPRFGIAYRVNDKTSVRLGFGRYVTPWSQLQSLDLLSAIYYGYNNYTGAPPTVQGVPQMQLSNPFPASNPVIPAYQKTLGRYTGLGDSITFVNPERPRQTSNRLNFSVQRQLPTDVLLDVTYYANLSNYIFDTSRNINMVDPNIAFTHKDLTNQVVANPFFEVLPVDKFPGPARYQRQVSLTSLMRPYPQYGNINVIDGDRGGDMRYHSLQLKLQKTFAAGYSFLFGYNYHRERDQVYYDDLDRYNQQYIWTPSPDPRHRLTMAGTWETPFGRGRKFLSGSSRLVDALVGGWNLTPLITWRSGRYIRFGDLAVNGDPRENVPEGYWFNPSVFSRLPAFTRRANPLQYDGLTGPQLFNMDAAIVKSFPIAEEVRFQLRMDVFNVTNNITWADPETSVQSVNFGRSINQLTNTYGRRAQLGLRVEF
ncbi:MAG TPA: carboxypeptidase regulatory-like domain-containing protein, partial [Bryobacteraceae bacterium]|nr:carboxypeptidase regulatory-like domain-containing protein [Bryobacteraceae bacterium]